MNKKILNFQTEVKQLLKLMINSLYSNKEIFLRELISNASDAIDKLRFKSFKNNKLLESDSNFKIEIFYNKIQKTITISDNGIGMTEKEITLNLGTIAKSGTKEFFSKLSNNQKKNANLIGQFGVGFYSGFIVADLITVNSRKAGKPKEKGISWQSKGTGEFSIENINKLNRGTEVILHLKKNEEEFLSSWKLKLIIKKYSDHISIPILMYKEIWDKSKKKFFITNKKEIINNTQALWTRNKSEIKIEEYNEFYKNITNDNKNPLTYIHNKIEGNNEYIQLLYIPSKAQLDIWDRKKKGGLKLYSQRVFILDNVKQLLPPYLRFIKGIIDSANLPLNISREILQDSKNIRIIKENSTKKVLNMLENLIKSDKKLKTKKYKIFWKNFGNILKEGLGEDIVNRKQIINLLRFNSTYFNKKEKLTSLKKYKKRMLNNQDNIYYITAENYKTAINSPHLEIFKKKNIEVLILIDRIDEWILSFLTEYKNKKLISIAKGNLNLGNLETDEEKKQKKEKEKKFLKFIKKIKLILKDKVQDVRTTSRLINSPACLISDENDISNNLIRILKSSGQNPKKNKQILEINPKHLLIKYIKKEKEFFNEWINILYNQAILSEGGNLTNPSNFINNLNKIFAIIIKKNKNF
ncbi:molecular chaperone HtpG [Candidatus Zinderia endosymbiont of Aphrophora alni]|uniref:molecular chaperone HtpG n=1 Tax=Candidatus Zinderia endosymbiont of Aphrophora alni TaxID=3077951 RepID=UPI0030D23CF4